MSVQSCSYIAKKVYSYQIKFEVPKLETIGKEAFFAYMARAQQSNHV